MRESSSYYENPSDSVRPVFGVTAGTVHVGCSILKPELLHRNQVRRIFVVATANKPSIRWSKIR